MTQDMEKEMLTLTGEVDDIIYSNEDTGYGVIALKTKDDLIVVVGELANVEMGEEIECKGSYTEHPVHGMQFRCEYFQRSLPKTVSAIEKYLASGVIKGIGRAKAKAIVKRFGEETFDIIDNEPERLVEVEGISRKLAVDIVGQFKKLFAVRGLTVFFVQYGIPMSSAVYAFRRWGESAEQLIKSNPYMLCGEGLGVSFEKADRIGQELQISRDSKLRLKAGICEKLRDALAERHTCMLYEELAAKSCELLGTDRQTFDSVLTEMLAEEELFRFDKANGRYILLRDYFRAENYISNRLSAMRSYSYDNKIDFSAVIDKTAKEEEIEYDEKQREAINLSLSYGFLVITGGPGTGKTTTLNAIIKLYKDQGRNVMIAAPTGRAAKRISELTGCDAKTIHRLLEVKRTEDGRMTFIHDERNKLDCDALIIDEMSMVDTLLFESLLNAIPLNCKLVLVGDSNQLPSIGAGNVLHDIIESEVMPVVKLTKIFRQAQKSKIITNAHRMMNDEMIDLANSKEDDFFFIEADTFAKVQGTVSGLCKKRLPDYYGCSPVDDIQVISPSRVGQAGVDKLNLILQETLNPKKAGKGEITAHGVIFRKNDKVMQTKNDYDIEWKKVLPDGSTESGAGIFNGDIGKIVSCNEMMKQITVDFDGKLATYNYGMLEDLELAYAITVHKSQGSEYEYVVLAIFGVYDRLNYRNLLYTAVTRAKKLLVIVGSKDSIRDMINNQSAPERNTCLLEMLKEVDRDNESEELL